MSGKTGDEMRTAPATARRWTCWLGHNENTIPEPAMEAVAAMAHAFGKMPVAHHPAGPLHRSRAANFISFARSRRRGHSAFTSLDFPPAFFRTPLAGREPIHAAR